MIGHPISQCKKLQIQNDEAGGTGDCKGQNNENVPRNGSVQVPRMCPI